MSFDAAASDHSASATSAHRGQPFAVVAVTLWGASILGACYSPGEDTEESNDSSTSSVAGESGTPPKDSSGSTSSDPSMSGSTGGSTTTGGLGSTSGPGSTGGGETHDSDPSTGEESSESTGEPPPSFCPDAVIEYLGSNAFSGSAASYAELRTDLRFDTALSFTGWVRFDTYTGEYNRVFDFGSSASHPDSQSLRLHRNLGNTLRVATNSFSGVSDFPDYWELGNYIFVTVTIDAGGTRIAYKNGAPFGADVSEAPSIISWDDPNYYVARSNWPADEPNSNISVHDLRWFDEAIDQPCIDFLMADNPPA